MEKKELLKHIGSIEQIGGIKDYILNDGKAKGVRAIEINTGKVRFVVLPDRGMDIAQAFYKEHAISWLSKAGVTAPAFYDKDEKEWLRGFYGGLITTCGLKNIGGPYKECGLHDRIAHIPAEKVSVFAEWIDDEYVMKISGEVHQSAALGENVVLKRTIIAKLFDDKFTVKDVVVNNGFEDENIALCYHCNFGYPLVRENSKVLGVPAEHSVVGEPTHGFVEECIDVSHEGDVATAGIENGEIGAYITYERKNLPDFLMWKMYGESDYVIGLEPRTTSLGGGDVEKEGKYVTLKPFEEYETKLVFSFKDLK